MASVLVANWVISFAGVMAFIFSDLIVIPVVRISAKYFGWKLAFYIVGVFALLGILPEGSNKVAGGDAFAIDYTFFLNLAFLALAAVLVWLHVSSQ